MRLIDYLDKGASLVTRDEVRAFVKERIGSVKAPKQVEVWADLPRSKLGKVLKPEIKSRLRGIGTQPVPPADFGGRRPGRAAQRPGRDPGPARARQGSAG